MPFIAECPFCKGMVRSPDDADGWSISCPKCANSFTLVPMRDPPRPGQPRSVAPKPVETAAPAVPSPVADTAAELHAVPTREEAVPPLPRLPPVPVRTPVRRKTKPRRPSQLGLASFLLGSVALLLVQVPVAGVLTIPLSGLGLLLGLIALATFDPARGRIVLPVAGTAVCLPVLVGSLFWPTLLGLAPRLTEEKLAGESAKTAVVALGSHAGDAPVPAQEMEWVDASSGAVQRGDVRIRITAVTVGPVEFKSADAKKRRFSKEKVLSIQLRVSNVGAARRIEYRGWDGPNAPVLLDAAGKPVKGKAFPPDAVPLGRGHAAVLAPGKFVDDVFFFEAPPADGEYLRLELLAAALGSDGAVRFRIPKAMIAAR